MDSLRNLVVTGSGSAWVYVPASLLLGALHGMEPGHSKTMMAAFIIAIRGTIRQAVLLGLCAALSHSLVIWILAALALSWGSHFSAESTEPYFQLISAVTILGLAIWTAWKTARDVRAEANHHHDLHHADHTHDDCASGHIHSDEESEYQDAHERGHALEIEKRFTGGPVSNAQIALFGLTGGLLPCPAAFTIVLVCLQLKRFTLGVSMVLSFSVGLAATLVLVGAVAAWSLHHAEKRFKGFGTLARRLPYLSSALLAALALFLGCQGWAALPK